MHLVLLADLFVSFPLPLLRAAHVICAPHYCTKLLRAYNIRTPTRCLKFCEGDGDVVGVVTPLRGVAQVVFHGVQVVEVGVWLRVHQDRGVEEDGEGQVEVEREEGEVAGEPHMCEDGMK